MAIVHVCVIHFYTNLTALMYSEELILNIITVGLESGHYFIQIWSKCFLDGGGGGGIGCLTSQLTIFQSYM